MISGEKGNDYECRTCDERKREQRNCHNRRRLRHSILQGAEEWRTISSTQRHVLKAGDIKFFECPTSAIKHRTWQILRLINETIGGEQGDILHLPYPGTILDQPQWYREAVRIVRAERAEQRRAQIEKRS